MPRPTLALLAAALALAAGAPGSRPGATTLTTSMRPCDEGLRGSQAAFNRYRSGGVTLDEARAAADAVVAACEAAQAAWRGTSLPPQVKIACLNQAQASVGLARAWRSALGRMTEPGDARAIQMAQTEWTHRERLCRQAREAA